MNTQRRMTMLSTGSFLQTPGSTSPARFADLDKACSANFSIGFHMKDKSVVPPVGSHVCWGLFDRHGPEVSMRVADLLVTKIDDC